MRRQQWRAAALVLAVLSGPALVLATAAEAQTTGRVGGEVVDASTGAPLPAVRIEVEGQGTVVASNAAGRFVIGGIPTGRVTLSVELLGYAPLILRDVGVRAGRATELRIVLEPSSLELDPLVVEAERLPIIEPDISETREIITGEVLRELPLTRVDEAVELATGVSDGHFRGGQLGQEVYLVDGFSVKNQVEATTGGASIELAPTSLQELEVVTGGLGAQYGGALSGVVSYVTRSGSTERWEGATALRSDHVAPVEASSGFTAFNAHGGGPVPFLGERSTLFADLHLEGLNDADPRARGLTCVDPADADPALAAAIGELRSDPASAALYCPFESTSLPGQRGDRLIGFLRLDRPTAGGRLTASVLHNRFQSELYTQELKYSSDTRLAQRRRYSLGTLAFEIGGRQGDGAKRLTLRLAAQRLDRYLGAVDRASLDARSGVAGFGLSDFAFLGEDEARRPIEEQIANPAPIPGYTTPRSLEGSPFGAAAENLFITRGTAGLANWTRSDLLGADIVGELFPASGSTFRGGLSGKLYRVEVYERTRAYLAGSSPNYARFFPATVSGFAEASIRPVELFVVNAGVRVEGFRNGLEFRQIRDDFLTPVLDTDFNVHFAPRIGMAGAFRNSAGRTAFRFNYARLAQPPDFQFFLDSTIGDSLRTDIRRQGNPNLAFEEGSSVEAGMSHQVGEHAGFEVVGFHKTLGDLVTGNVQLVGSSQGQFTTGDKGTVNGLEISATGRWPDLQVRLGYALQKAEGLTTGAFADTGQVEPGRPEPVPLAFDRRHTVDFTMLLGQSARAAGRHTGGGPLGGALTARARSGYPLFPLEPTDAEGRPNPIGRLPWTTVIDAAATWALPTVPGCDRCRTRLLVEVKNLVGRDNVIALRRTTGTISPSLAEVRELADLPTTSTFPIPRESERYTSTVDLDQNGLIDEDEFATARFAAALDRNDPSLFFGSPRQIRVGVEVTF